MALNPNRRKGYIGGRATQRSSAQVRNFLEQMNQEVSQLADPVFERLAPQLVKATAEVRAQLAEAINAGKAETFTEQKLRATLAQLQPSLNKLNELNPAMFDSLTAGYDAAADLGMAHVDRQLSFWLGDFKGSLVPLPFKQAADLATPGNSLLEMYAARSQIYTNETIADIKAGIIRGYLKGQTGYEMARDQVPILMRQEGIDPGEAIAEGIKDRLLYRAERIVRTESAQAYNAVSEESMSDVAAEVPELQPMKRWVGILDGRICEACEDLDGEEVDINDNFPGGASIPLHPFCRCLSTIVFKALE